LSLAPDSELPIGEVVSTELALPIMIGDFAFGADQVPQRHRRVWRELLSGCPAGISETVWLQAVFDARDLFSTWGAKIEQIG
jgi:hypothetical protein